MSTKPKLSNGASQFGCQMGRPNDIYDRQEQVKFRLYQIDMCGDYDRYGAYWGSGPTLGKMYHAYGMSEIQGEDNQVFVRGKTREEAKAEVLKIFRNAKFWR